ncbi:hypothetical protein Tco_1285130 [Tanacetum coccineum]
MFTLSAGNGTGVGGRKFAEYGVLVHLTFFIHRKFIIESGHIKEYIELEAEKTRRRGQEFNWETDTYGKVRYFEDIDYFKDFENEFPAIVYNDALTSEPEVSSDFKNEFPAIVYNGALATDHKISSEPSVSPLDNNKIDFRISLDEFDDEDYICIYDKSSFSYKLISINDLKTDSGNDNDKVNIELPPEDASIKSSDSIINDNVNTNSHEFNESFETNHDIHLMLAYRPVFTTHNLAHKRNMKDHTEQIPGSFSF